VLVMLMARVSAGFAGWVRFCGSGLVSRGQGLGAGLWVRGSGGCWQLPQPGQDLGKQVVAGR